MSEPIFDEAFDPAMVEDLIARAKLLATEYRERTGRPLGITGEVAEFEAARLLGLRLAPVRQKGYDAVQLIDGRARKVQIKGRVVMPGASKGQRISKMDLRHEWDVALLVLLDDKLTATTIYEAERSAVEAALRLPGSRARNQRGQLGLSKFRSIARVVWPLAGDAVSAVASTTSPAASPSSATAPPSRTTTSR